MFLIKMKCLRSLVGMSRLDRVRNEEVRGRAGIEREVASTVDQRVLRWFWVRVENGRVPYRMTRRVLMVESGYGVD